MSEEPFPLVEVATDVFVRQVRAVWSSSDGQTYIRVDDHCTIVTATPIATVVRKWTEATR